MKEQLECPVVEYQISSSIVRKLFRKPRSMLHESSHTHPKCAYHEFCGIIPLCPGLGGEAEATAREHAAQRDAQLQPFGRAREKGVDHWLVTRSRPVVHLRERPVTG